MKPVRDPRLTAILLLISGLSVYAAAADEVLIHYHSTGINGGPPTETLTVYESGVVEFVLDSFATRDTVADQLDSTELQELTGLFIDNGFNELDTLYFSGCLSCPEFSVTFGGKNIRGNTPMDNDSLGSILTGLDDFINELKQSTRIVMTKRKGNRAGDHVPARAALMARSSGIAAQYGILRLEKGGPCFFSIHGRLLGKLGPVPGS